MVSKQVVLSLNLVSTLPPIKSTKSYAIGPNIKGDFGLLREGECLNNDKVTKFTISY